jgi:hypothetical protein
VALLYFQALFLSVLHNLKNSSKAVSVKMPKIKIASKTLSSKI